jgi:hypothetical protein
MEILMLDVFGDPSVLGILLAHELQASGSLIREQDKE